MDAVPTAVAPEPRGLSFRDRLAGLRRSLPPARIVWMALVVMGIYGSSVIRWIDLPTLILLPVLAVGADLAFQRARYPALRFPDAALATGLFVALLLPPLAPLIATGALTVVGIAGRHLLRWHGRPLLNPAASTVVLGSLVFGLAPAWLVGIGPFGFYLMIGLGLILILRTPTSWRFPVLFLLTYGLLTVVQHVLLGAATSGQLLLLAVVDPSTVFFALFMMPEPRGAPAAVRNQVSYAGFAGILAAFLPIWWPTVGILVSLLLVNLGGLMLLRSPSTVRRAAPRSAGTKRRARSRGPGQISPGPVAWSTGTRVGAGLLAIILLVASVAALPQDRVSLPPGAGSGGTGGVTLTNCAKDNPAIPPSTLSQLHQMLGPSVILSYDSHTGVVRFYDPVNHVTVIESDLYEDYGFAEFNGDDFAISGCSP